MTNITEGAIREYFNKTQLLDTTKAPLKIWPANEGSGFAANDFMAVHLDAESRVLGRGGKDDTTYWVSMLTGDVLDLGRFGSGSGHTTLVQSIKHFYESESFRLFLKKEKVVVGNVTESIVDEHSFDDVVAFTVGKFGDKYSVNRIVGMPLFWHISDQPDVYFEHDEDPKYMTFGTGGYIILRKTGEIYELGGGLPLGNFIDVDTYDELKKKLEDDEAAKPFNGGNDE